jgi:nitroimidazol reductase NimA-like FMN-containing flavoprotein (pyridoxamine 5'-phosphate oxidase superfamily)
LNDKTVYVVPISYAYDGNYIYCHSYEGKKLEFMRKNPAVCFQVDKMKNMANWKSVIAWGDFEEITDKNEIRKAVKILLERQLPPISSITTHLGATWPFPENNDGLDNIPGVFFRIGLTQKTGKFEAESESLITYY